MAAVGAFLQRRPLRVEFETIGLHECRHAVVSMMSAAGVPLERIGDYVGHSSAYMTDRCRHLIEWQAAEDGRRVHDYLSAGTGTQSGTQPRLVAAQPQG